MKIGILTHSTHPRGGVVHTLQLGEALAAAGHAVTLMAPARPGQAFYRAITGARVALAPVAPHAEGVPAMVEARIGAYLKLLRALLAREPFDVLHAQDSISGNALATLAEEGLIGGFVRTVHHLDQFEDARLAHWQTRAFASARTVLCVSDTWVGHMREHYGIVAHRVANGVDLDKFDGYARPGDREVAARYGIRRGGPVFLAVGGVEQRKNTLAMLHAFARFKAGSPQAQLVIVGGASLLDHDDYARRFHADLFALGFGGSGDVVVTGTVADAEMPALYRLADVFVMASLAEGFGLSVLEALASGTPVVVSNRAPFTEYLGASDCHFADPLCTQSIAQAMADALGRVPSVSDLLEKFSWAASAQRHAHVYGATAANATSTSNWR
jgi:glycosyltransferase-like protein